MCLGVYVLKEMVQKRFLAKELDTLLQNKFRGWPPTFSCAA